jgi:hypothetical protein
MIVSYLDEDLLIVRDPFGMYICVYVDIYTCTSKYLCTYICLYQHIIEWACMMIVSYLYEDLLIVSDHFGKFVYGYRYSYIYIENLCRYMYVQTYICMGDDHELFRCSLLDC